jgi:putative hydrolase of the HAD superfamily
LQVATEFAPSLPGHPPGALADMMEAALDAFWSDPDKARDARLRPGGGIRQARQTVIEERFRALALPDPAELAAAFSVRFTELRALGGREFDGARHTLETLRHQGVRLALVTNGAAEIQRAKIARFTLAPLFDHIQIEGDHGFGKPEPRAYLHAMEALRVEPRNTWMVGDNLEWEVAAPQRLGIFGIWHDHLGRGLPAQTSIRPNRIIQSLRELLD